MRLFEPFRKRRADQRRAATAMDPFAGFTSRDWADLPPFHPDATVAFRSR